MEFERTATAAVSFLLLATGSAAQPAEGKSGEVTKKAEDIARQPARDLGLSKHEIPTLLVEARRAPYSLAGLKTCKQLVGAIVELNVVLGPDFTGEARNENRAGKLAEAGGKAVVNTIIPFRGLVREVSGAAPAQRAMNDALDAGYARRGFLRGVHKKQGCRPNF